MYTVYIDTHIDTCIVPASAWVSFQGVTWAQTTSGSPSFGKEACGIREVMRAWFWSPNPRSGSLHQGQRTRQLCHGVQ